jgi:class 3 adenylate cyclase
VVAGIIGLKKFAYDVWGDTVNIASQMESTAPTGAIQVSGRTGQRLVALYRLEPREPVVVRGQGELSTFLLAGRQPDQPEALFPCPRPEPAEIIALAPAVLAWRHRAG